MLGVSLDTVMTVSCNDRLYEINLSTMKADAFDLEGNPTGFCDSLAEFDILLDRIYSVFRHGLRENLPYELRFGL